MHSYKDRPQHSCDQAQKERKKEAHAQTHLEATYDIELAAEHAHLRVGNTITNTITTHAGYDEDLALSYLSDSSRYLCSHPFPWCEHAKREHLSISSTATT